MFAGKIPGTRPLPLRLPARLILVSLAAMSPPVSHAGFPFLTDDPGTVDPGSATLFVAYAYDRTGGLETHSVPFAEATFGFEHRLECAVATSLLLPDRAIARSPKLDNLTLTPKWRFLDQDGATPAIAIACAATLPTGMNNYVYDGCSLDSYLTAGWAVGEHWQFSLEAGAVVPTRGEYRNRFQGGVSAGYSITERWLLGFDLYGNGRVSQALGAGCDIGVATQVGLTDSWSVLARVAHSFVGPTHFTAFIGPQLNF